MVTFKKISQAVAAYRPGAKASKTAIREDITAAPPSITLYPTVAPSPSTGRVMPGRLQTPLTPSLVDGLGATDYMGDTRGIASPSMSGAGPSLYDDIRAAANDFGLGSAGESGADIESAAEDSGISSEAADSGLIEQLLSTLGSEAAALGMTLEAYASKILKDYPWLGPILGVATGAALVSLFMSLKGDGTSSTSTRTTTTKKKSKAKKPKYMGKAEYAAWKKARGKSGSISQKEYHSKVWPYERPKKKKKKAAPHHHVTHHKEHHHKHKKKGKGKRVSFMADGKRVTFTAKR